MKRFLIEILLIAFAILISFLFLDLGVPLQPIIIGMIISLHFDIEKIREGAQ